MRLAGLNFDWLSRLGRVIFVIAVLLVLLLAYTVGEEQSWEEMSIGWFSAAATIAIGFLLLVIATKTLLYIVKGENFWRSGFGLTHYLLLAAPIVVTLVVATIFALFVEPAAKQAEKQAAKDAYMAAKSKADSLQGAYNTCLVSASDVVFQKKMRDCELLQGKIKSSYDDCVRWEIGTPTACLYSHDYKGMDCSEAALRAQILTVQISDMTPQCQVTARSYNAAKAAADTRGETNSYLD